MFKTFMRGDLCMVTFLHFTRKTGPDANFLLIQFSEFFIGSVFPSPIVGSVSMFKTFINAWRFMGGDLSAIYPRKCQEKIRQNTFMRSRGKPLR